MKRRLARWWYHVDTLYVIYAHEFISKQKWACKLGWHQRAYTLYREEHPVTGLLQEADWDNPVWEKSCFRCDWKDEVLHVW